MSDNIIAGGLDTLVDKCPELTYLNLSGNKIKEPNTLKVLVSSAGNQRGRPVLAAVSGSAPADAPSGPSSFCSTCSAAEPEEPKESGPVQL